jgi:hypothetical protein
MRRALTKLLPEDHPSIEKRSCKRRDNNERPKYQNVRVSFSSAAFSFDSVLAVGGAAHRRSGWLRLGVLSFVTSFYGNGGMEFPDKIQAVGKLAGSYEYTNTTGGNVLDGAISRAARAMPLQFGLFSSEPR